MIKTGADVHIFFMNFGSGSVYDVGFTLQHLNVIYCMLMPEGQCSWTRCVYCMQLDTTRTSCCLCLLLLQSGYISWPLLASFVVPV